MKYIIPLITAIILTFSSCKHDDLELYQENKNYRAAADFIRNNYDLTLFYAALERAGMMAELSGSGPFTILAPSNQAFNDLGFLKAEDFQKVSPETLKLMLGIHIIPRKVSSAEVQDNSIDVRFTALSGVRLYVTLAGNVGKENHLYFNGSEAIEKDVVLSNGVLHVLDKVIKYTPGTVQDILNQHPEYSTFVSVLKRYGLWEQLASEGPWTVFAVPNKVFEENGLDEAGLARIKPDQYIIPRLFGIYLMAKQHYFLSDIASFKYLTGESGVSAPIPDDFYLMSILWESMWVGDKLVSVFKIGSRESRIHYPKHEVISARKALQDFKADNGIVHDLQGMIVTPEEAKK
ncbi:fasciclin domain-containing protein [Chitinophaga nivalis]|uniref:Fasciclin domain-containing protein n=1 Tax=Chitinophaga nivalis TaxID=2991709 RepID=A0ABT3IGK2_9BACT|nr:fasciclin domain-containing protein [Chitinophaga nivalis]MCW3467213.1 fasciclin domain-containing protein [Chitinophaga nivalis]MCW3483095.1 fasciclin domain-containing protein [Chitinophaga nivalis]